MAVGYLEEPDGSVLVAAGDPDADWTRNLEADPRCTITVGVRSWPAIAEPLDGAEKARAVTGLILKYGTPSEGLGRGSAFRLRPASS